MMSRQLRQVNTIALLLLAVIASACHRHVPAPLPPPAPAAAAAPSVTLTVEPGSIQQGESATLRWNSQNATDLNIDPDVGRVEATGSQVVSPSESTTYTLTGRGPGGSTQTTARLTVTAGPASESSYPPSSEGAETTLEQRFQAGVADAFYDYDKADIRADARAALTRDVAFLQQNPSLTIQIEGHCDVRGSTAYNLGLGDRRANAARDFLVSQGVSANRISTISYGKERPFCTEDNEDCYQQNRRAHLVCTNCGR